VCCCIAQEIDTLPKGGQELGSEWYANNRLAYSTCAMRFWTSELVVWITVCSRCMEKTPQYSVALMWEGLRRMRAFSFEEFVLWSDGAPNYKCGMLIGSIHHDMMKHFGWKKATNNFFASKHGKSDCDRHFGDLKKLKMNIYKGKTLRTVDQVVAEYEAAYEVKNSPPTKQFVFLNWDPPERSLLTTSIYSAKTFQGLRSSYCFTSSVNDERRKQWFGKGAEALTLTALWFCNYGITDLSKTCIKRCHPAIREAEDEEPEEPAIAAEAEVEEPVTWATKMHRGWRYSYCTAPDESTKAARIRTFLKRGAANIGHIDRGFEGKRRSR
jgi:hypothetical protein